MVRLPCPSPKKQADSLPILRDESGRYLDDWQFPTTESELIRHVAAVWSRARGKPTLRLAVRSAAARCWWQQILIKLTAPPNCHAVANPQA
jgi:hypothetical protein